MNESAEKTTISYGSEQYAANALTAARLEYPTRTITVLMDERPGFSVKDARELVCLFMEMGYWVQELTAKEFCRKAAPDLGFLVVLPHAESVPAMCGAQLDAFWSRGGRVLVLGGRLFAQLIVPGADGGFEKGELLVDDVDAASSGKMFPIRMEGFTPSHKVFETEGIRTFRTDPAQALVHSTLASAGAESLVCPQARTHGAGFRMGHPNRFIPLVQAYGTGGRANGLRGAAAHIMLTDICAHAELYTDDHRLGNVKSTNRGACAAGIGLKRQDLLHVHGMRELITELVDVLHRGLFLFEGGSERLVVDRGETVQLGAQIMNLNADYELLQVAFCVRKNGETVFTHTEPVLAIAIDMTDVAIPFTASEFGTYEIETQLLQNGTVIDQIVHTVQVPEPVVAQPDDFVRVENGEFMLHGKPWRAFGIDYWPLYTPGLENVDYWKGWQDHANYDAEEIEADLAFLEEMGINCLFTRLDGNLIGRCVDTMRDFVLRCRRHGMKLMFSCCSMTAPLQYQSIPFRAFMEKTKLIDDPTLFAHDVAWEYGEKFHAPLALNRSASAWSEWIVSHYGSVENAERDWGVPADRTPFGQVIAPPVEEFMNDGPWRVKICAYRRFLYNWISRTWGDAAADIRSFDPHHLITTRTAAIGRNSVGFSGGIKHLDFTTPEAWRMPNDDCGEYHAIIVPLLLEFTTRGKPIVWAEYGVSTTDMGWRKFEWDIENIRPLAHKVKEQETWLKRFFRTHKVARINGTAPWWFPGGLRRSEKSDCGLCNPDGTWRPCGEEYVKMGEWFRIPKEKPAPTCLIPVDPDAYATGWTHYIYGEAQPGDEKMPIDGNYNRLLGEVRGEATIAVAKAMERGEVPALCTTGTGTTSADMPLLAVGNVPMNGTNPPKYLDAEFNFLEIRTADGQIQRIKNGAHLPAGTVQLRANVGNLQEATWLKLEDSETGGVYLQVAGAACVHAPIEADTPYLTDVQTEWVTLTAAGTYTLRMAAYERGAFGEIWVIHLEA